MRLSGVAAARAFPGAMNTAMFEDYVGEVLVPELRPGDVVIWDNLQPHKPEEAIAAVEEAGASVVPLPPWSPDLTPIEQHVAKLKGLLRKAAARTLGTMASARVNRDCGARWRLRTALPQRVAVAV